MKYLIHELSKIAGVSTRTLRYYDEIGLLKPPVNSSGYRIYGKDDVDLLQQILFYRELGFTLERIRIIINDPGFDIRSALEQHLDALRLKKQRLDVLFQNVKNSIAEKEGGINMLDKEKFEGFKKTYIAENEKKYGQEIRRKFGDETIDKSNARFMRMDEKRYNEISEMEKEILRLLHAAYQSGDPACDTAQEAASMHRQWLTAWWGFYDTDSHIAIAQMYTQDDRFKKYYDAAQPGLAKFLRDAIQIYVSKQHA